MTHRRAKVGIPLVRVLFCCISCIKNITCYKVVYKYTRMTQLYRKYWPVVLWEVNLIRFNFFCVYLYMRKKAFAPLQLNKLLWPVLNCRIIYVHDTFNRLFVHHRRSICYSYYSCILYIARQFMFFVGKTLVRRRDTSKLHQNVDKLFVNLI